MRVTSLELRAFRNYEACQVLPGEGMTVFLGPNAQGKTNLLEALHLCCTGRSHRTSKDEEMIRWGEDVARVSVLSTHRDGTHDVALRLSRLPGKKKEVLIGGSSAGRIAELFGHVFGVLFSPEDLQIIKGGPQMRRRFLDMQLSQLTPAYFAALQQATHALHQRNALLKTIAFSGIGEETLPLWDEQLALHGGKLITLRRKAVEALSNDAAAEHAQLTGGKEALSLRYLSDAGEADDPVQCLREKLFAARGEDIRRGTTTCGFHRDELLIAIDGKEARVFASQGQQRTAMLSLRLAQTVYAARERGENPILMLDDVMSELDPSRRQLLAERIDRMQTFVTCTDISDLAGSQKGMLYRVEKGHIVREN